MANAATPAYNGSLGQSPQRASGAERLVRGSAPLSGRNPLKQSALKWGGSSNTGPLSTNVSKRQYVQCVRETYRGRNY